ncbi:MAG: 2-iminoacetate synthase ThiH [Peptococcaceae bacterium]|jgi:2-iminoacetate synthase|nr:2-iminoacetate synthase ThiH [Peptococcaceae bacterium]
MTAILSDPGTYLPDMEIIESELLEQVLAAAAAFQPERYSGEDIRRVLNQRECSPEDFAALLSPAAAPFLEEIAQKAQQETSRHFGNSVYLFTPLYLSNYCENYCVYCGFNSRNRIQRSRLNREEMEAEMRAIAATGLEEVLLLTGESPHMADVEYIGEACRLARKYFRVIGLEVYPMDSEAYAYLHQCGADFVTVFQETYDLEQYGKLHLEGRKRVFPYRFYAQERALRGGVRGVGFAALLGLADFRRDALAAGLHAYFLQRKYPRAEISFSCPRVRPIVNHDQPQLLTVTEAQLLQVVMAYRLFMPFAGITISSRESRRFRDHVVGIAATKISAGVEVGIGGHAGKAKGDEQFEIDDGRSVGEIYEMLASRNMQPVMSEYIYLGSEQKKGVAANESFNPPGTTPKK